MTHFQTFCDASLTSKVSDGEILVFRVVLWRFEGELLSGSRQVLVLGTEGLNHLFKNENHGLSEESRLNARVSLEAI